MIEGKASAYVFASNGCKKWDTCGPEAVLEADGGCLTDMLGRHYTYGKNIEFPNKSGVLGTSKHQSHEAILKNIPDDVKKAMQS